ncbi:MULTISPECIES: hypothetical protein [unclassified Helicobacter]|uniref:hypothetical protein n=1 Tax=unclassified Helicobacter TaxID=2593540 RepID=UPI001315AA9A|nr:MULTISPECIES: hypothetical protein [unclassified Helicobacter]
MGHYVRCDILRKKLLSMGFEVLLYAYNQKDNKREAWFYQENILAYLNDIDFIIIDSYQADYEVYNLALNKVKRVLVIDDVARIVFPKECIIFNGGIDTSKFYPEKYHRVFAGVEYMICDEKFFQTKDKKKNNTLLICFGGGDAMNFSQKVYDRLKDMPYNFIIVLGNCYQETFRGRGEIHQGINEDTMRDIFQRIDFAITAGGRMLNELLMSEVPALIIPTAQNQYHQVEAYVKQKVILKTTLETLKEDIFKIKTIDIDKIRDIKKIFGSKLNRALKEVLVP